MPGYDDGKFAKVVVSPSAATAGSTVASLSVAVSTSAVAGIYAPIVTHPPAISIAPPDHQIYALIGRVVSAWAHLEHTLDLIIWDLMGIEPAKGACVTAQMIGATNRYRTIISLLRQRSHRDFNALIASVDKLMKKSYDLAEDRNRIVHDPWYLYDTNVAQFRAMPVKDPRFGVCEIDTAEIEEFLATAKARSDESDRLTAADQRRACDIATYIFCTSSPRFSSVGN